MGLLLKRGNERTYLRRSGVFRDGLDQATETVREFHFNYCAFSAFVIPWWTAASL
jgi:hypothetical protein